MTDLFQSTPALEPPPAKFLLRFDVSQVGEDTLRTYLETPYSLRLCCKDCRRTIEWTPPELLRRFGRQVDLPLKVLVPRLACKGEGGCGSHDIAVYPQVYREPWRWPPREA